MNDTSYSRRQWLYCAGGIALGWHSAHAFSAGPATANGGSRGWLWKQLVPHSDKRDDVPVPRDPWNGMLPHNGSLYLFGGAYPRYGPPRGPADLKTLGVLNDLWRFDLQSGTWHEILADDGQTHFDPSARRPCGRVLPCWVEANGKFYLFGGLTVLGAGWKIRLLNDLWSFDPATERWSLLESDDRRILKSPTEVDGKRPSALAAMGATVIGNRIFMYAGWGGDRAKGVLSPQLWSFDVISRTWTVHGNGDDKATSWPAKRYCPAVTTIDGKLYVWGGRDTTDRSPQFYNDLWSFDPAINKWTQLAGNATHSALKTQPSARYAMGHARVGKNWYMFGGFGAERGNSPQLNDLWRLDVHSGRWTLIQPHDGDKTIGPEATRPCARRVPAMTAHDDKVYLFGGLDLTSGPDERGPLVGFNDLWQGQSPANLPAD